MLLTLGVPLLVACSPFSGFVHDEVLDGPYRLVAVDVDEDMGVCLTSDIAAGNCVGDGLPGATVFAAGADANYVVVARHPRKWPSPPDRDVTEYYYVERTPDEAKRGVPAENVKGPFSARQFEQERRRLGLPEFSRVFDQLR